jgi:hypothetical protein
MLTDTIINPLEGALCQFKKTALLAVSRFQFRHAENLQNIAVKLANQKQEI